MTELTRRHFQLGLAALAVPCRVWAQRRDGVGVRLVGGIPSTGWMPFDFYQQGRIFLDVMINGIPAAALLDSGSSRIVLDSAFARRLGMRPGRPFAAHGLARSGTGSVSSDPIEVVTGPLRVASRSAVLLDMAPLSHLLGRPLLMLLGRDLFENLIVDIDFPHRQVAFHDPRRFAEPAGAREVPLIASGGVRSIPISIEGRPPVQGTFDLGSSGTIALSPRYATRALNVGHRRATSTLSGGVEGAVINRMVMLAGAEIGGIQLGGMPAVVYEEWFNDVAGVDIPAQLGIQLFSRLRILTDYGRNRLLLLPDPAVSQLPFPKDRAGLSVAPRLDHLEIMHVRRSGPAEAAGLAVGGRIVAIDGVPIDAGYTNGDVQFWMNRSAGTLTSLDMGNGRIVTLTLQDYF
jgi:predicted aspartyl protease